MGERGSPAKPIALKKAQGTYRPWRDSDDVHPETKAHIPTSLTDGAKAEWKRLAPELERLGLLTGNDVAAFAAYCECYATVKEATRTLKKEGLTVGNRAHPAVKIRQEALLTMRQYLREFGLSPSSRARLPGKTPAKQVVTDEDWLFGVN